MKEFNAEPVRKEGASALETVQQEGSEKRYVVYVVPNILAIFSC